MDSLRTKGSGGDLRESKADGNAFSQTSRRRWQNKRQDAKARGMADPRKVHCVFLDRGLNKTCIILPPIPWIITLMHYQQDPSSCRLPLLLAGCCTPTVVLDEGHLHSSRNEPIITPAGQDFSGDRELPHGEYKHLYDDDRRGNVRRYNM